VLVLAFAVQAFTKLPSMPWLARNRVAMLAVPVSCCIARTRLLDPVAEILNDIQRFGYRLVYHSGECCSLDLDALVSGGTYVLTTNLVICVNNGRSLHPYDPAPQA
jgi:hypothetical protein